MSEDDPAPDKKQKSSLWPDVLMDLFSQPIWDALSHLTVGAFRLVGAVLPAVLEVLL